jgi:hypothetical protein
MMHPEAIQPSAAMFDPALPPPRDKLPTLPFDLDEYARWSCLPDADDELVFTAGPALEEMHGRVPRVVDDVALEAILSPVEALMLSLVDGMSPVRILVRLVGTDMEEAWVVLCDLYARGLVAFD